MRDGVEDLEIELLLEALYRHYHYDFRHYARASVKRRLTEARARLGFANFSAMQEGLLHDGRTLPRLLNYLTVQVSEMFRDPGYYRALREQVIPHLATYPSLKVWIAGCSNGEELYSLSILFREEGLADRTIFYATDINPEALRAAEAGFSTRWTRSRSIPKTTRIQVGAHRFPTTTWPITVGRSLTEACAARWSFQTTVW